MVAVIVPGLFATVALPAYAFAPVSDTGAAEASAAVQKYKETDAQTVRVPADATAAAVARDAFSATTPEELAAEAQRAALAASYASYSGPRVSDYLANPPYPGFSLDGIVSVAMQYQGVPYVYGGADPSGFDCSGFVQFVYAQFGVGLPHSTGGQAGVGTRIDKSAALPGDVVIMGGHNGIYLGGNMMIDAPVPGDVVGVHSIWTSNYYIVRFGI